MIENISSNQTKSFMLSAGSQNGTESSASFGSLMASVISNTGVGAETSQATGLSANDFGLILGVMLKGGATNEAIQLIGALSGVKGNGSYAGISGMARGLNREDLYGLNSISQKSGAGAIPSAASKAVTPFVSGNVANRSPELYRSVIDQFNVETNPRYTPNKKGRNDTYCNIFLWDVTLAMGAEIPHYIDPETKEPMHYPDVTGARELTANATYDWLAEKGEQYGWRKVSAEQAQQMANMGCPAITVKKNYSGKGHVQIVCPSLDGSYDPERGVTVAQAGSRLVNYGYLKSVSGQDISNVEYYVHD